MVTEIRLYIEGGGDSRDGKAFLRQGFGEFFRDLNSMARNRKIKWQIVTCGSRHTTLDAFRTSMQQRPDAFNVAVVDAEGPVKATPWSHLQQRGEWQGDCPPEGHCHLMAQTMEAWFVADRKALSAFYGLGFSVNSIPANPNVEQIDKNQLEASLRAATRNTQKGEYHKIRHAHKLLGMVDAAVVRGAAPHCERLFATLQNKML